jgi:hypothetical protein
VQVILIIITLANFVLLYKPNIYPISPGVQQAVSALIPNLNRSDLNFKKNAE